MDVQLRKGILELCVLAALREKDSYGYQIIRDISQVVEISESTLYPILRRMELGGAVESYQIPYSNRLRKYHHLTPQGQRILADFAQEKEQLIAILDYITGGNTDESGTIFESTQTGAACPESAGTAAVSGQLPGTDCRYDGERNPGGGSGEASGGCAGHCP